MRKRLLMIGGILVACVLLCAAVLGGLLIYRTEGAYFDSDGVRIHYTIEGKGEPLILIHGVAANADLNWRRPGVVRQLARDFKVITFDLRGHGLSGKPSDPSQYGLPMVEDLSRLMDHLKIEKAHMAGYSLGGFILLKYMMLHPERVHSAALCAAGWKNPEDASPVPSPYRSPVKPQAAPVPDATPRIYVKESLADAGAPLVKKSKSVFHRVRSWVGDQLIDEGAKKALKQSYVQLAVFQSQLENNRVPAICFIGDKDGFRYLAEDLRDHLKGVTLTMLSGANHFSLPFYGKFKEGLNRFFKEHPMEGAPERASEGNELFGVRASAR